MKFQSLIGKIQTEGIVVKPEETTLFQSLIGKIQTVLLSLICRWLYRFQSLIGKIQTEVFTQDIEDMIQQVSIPNR